MTSILFWNINKKPLLEEIKELCHDNDVDIVVLAECQLLDVQILQTINPNRQRKFIALYNQLSRLSQFYRYSPESIRLVRDRDRVTI